MAKAIVARENGDDYQRLVLWIYICKFLYNNSDIETISHEFDEVNGFDDIVIKYKSPIICAGERKIDKEYIQVKYHQQQSDFLTIDNLMKPKFINSKSKSFLEKLKSAFELKGVNYDKCLFTLYTPFDIEQNDTLYKIVDNHDRMIKIDSFFDGTKTTQRAKDMKKILEHLKIEDQELKLILTRVRFYRGPSFPELIEHLNQLLVSNRLVPISNLTVKNSYIELAKHWLAGNSLHLSKEFILKECEAECLLSPKVETEKIFAIKTFLNNTTYLEREEIETVDISDLFNSGKYLKDEYEWESIHQRIKSFCCEKENTDVVFSVHLECSLTTAFLLGRIVNPKSGLCVYPMQKTSKGTVSWKNISSETFDSFGKICQCNEYISNEDGTESILMISITNDVENDVMEYFNGKQHNIRKVYHIQSKDCGVDSIKNGVQSWNVSNFVAKLLGSRTSFEKREMTHVFVSAPSALMFTLGKLSLNMGHLVLYEHDMKYEKKIIYVKSATFPMKGE